MSERESNYPTSILQRMDSDERNTIRVVLLMSCFIVMLWLFAAEAWLAFTIISIYPLWLCMLGVKQLHFLIFAPLEQRKARFAQKRKEDSLARENKRLHNKWKDEVREKPFHLLNNHRERYIWLMPILTQVISVGAGILIWLVMVSWLNA